MLERLNYQVLTVAIPCSKGLLLHALDISRLLCRHRKVAIPCSKGLLLHEMTIRLFGRLIIPVAIPCSKGLLLHAIAQLEAYRQLLERSQSPVQRVYCCMRIYTIAGQLVCTLGRNPLFKGSTVACCGFILRFFEKGESQSPVQRVYCCMSPPFSAASDRISWSQSPVQRVYCCMWQRIAE